MRAPAGSGLAGPRRRRGSPDAGAASLPPRPDSTVCPWRARRPARSAEPDDQDERREEDPVGHEDVGRPGPEEAQERRDREDPEDERGDQPDRERSDAD